MITKIGPFELGQPIDQLPQEDFQKLSEVSLSSWAAIAKRHPLSASRGQLKDVPEQSFINSSDIDKAYEIRGVPFMDLNWNGDIAVTENRISAIMVTYQAGQYGEPTSKGDIESVFKRILADFESRIGKAHTHPFLSKLYIWYLSEGTVILEQLSAWNIHEVGLIVKLNRKGLKVRM